MINKRGQSEFVAYVLLIGMAVGLATIVGVWMFGNSERVSDNIVRQSQISEKCDQISIAVFADKSGCPNTIPNKINLSNKGNFIIERVNIINLADNKNCFSNVNDGLINLKPGASVLTKTLNNCNTATILPLVNILENEIVGCSEKKLVLSLVC
mgnify:CR=1 FL=1